MDPITLLIYFLIAILVLGIIWYIAGAVGLPANVRNIVVLVAVLIVVLWLLRSSGLF